LAVARARARRHRRLIGPPAARLRCKASGNTPGRRRLKANSWRHQENDTTPGRPMAFGRQRLRQLESGAFGLTSASVARKP